MEFKKYLQKVNPRIIVGLLLLCIVGYFGYILVTPQIVESKVREIFAEKIKFSFFIEQDDVVIKSIYYNAFTKDCVAYFTVKGDEGVATMNLNDKTFGTQGYDDLYKLSGELNKLRDQLPSTESDSNSHTLKVKKSQFKSELVESVEAGDKKWKLVYQAY